MAGNSRDKRTARRVGWTVSLAFIAGSVFSGWFWRKQIVSAVRHLQPYVRRPTRVTSPVLIINRWSGDGKAEMVGLEQAAQLRGIRTIMLTPSDDLAQLAQDAIDGGADAIGMAGGDGSLGLVAGVAVERDVPFFCIPVGTRNHFALDLGLDRDDPLSALEAIDGDELLIDHGVVGDRVFLNNVSLGVYAAAVHQDGYREQKVKTVAEVLKETAADPNRLHALRVTTPDGERFARAPLVLISNNRYVMSGPPDFGRRARLDAGVLGVAAATSLPDPASVSFITLSDLTGWHEWEAQSFSIDSDDDVILAGVDGEALMFSAPLELFVRPRCLRVLVPSGVFPGYLPPREAVAARLLDMAEIGGSSAGSGGV